MFDGIRKLFARRTAEPRYPAEQRVSWPGRTLAGVVITADTAITVPAVYACLRYLSQTVAVLPWRVMRETETGGEIAGKHPIDWIIRKRPAKEWSSFQFRETLTHWALRYGNGYAEIERDQLGRPFALWPIHPQRVTPKRDMVTNELIFEVSNGVDGKTIIASADMFHIRGFGEGPVGINIMDYAAESIGWARAAQLFGAAFFGNGMNTNGVVKVKKGLTDIGLKRLEAKLKQLFQGPWRANKSPVVLDNEAEWQATTVEPDKAQFIATNQHLVEEVCRWFGVPPHKVMHLLRSTFSNIEHQAIEVVVDSISPWVKRFEDEADFKLFGQNRNGFYTKMNMNALLRGDMKARMEFYKGMQYVGAYTPNRILQLEDEQTIGPEGDIHVMQSQFVPLEMIGEQPEPASPPAADTEDDDEQDAMNQILRKARMMEPANG